MVWLKSKLINKLVLLVISLRILPWDALPFFTTMFWIHFGDNWYFWICFQASTREIQVKGMSELLHMINSVVAKYNSIHLGHNPMTNLPFWTCTSYEFQPTPNPEMACCWLQNLKKKVEFEISKKMSTWWYWRWKISSKAVDHETSSSPSSKIPNLITQIGGHQQPPLQRSLIWSYMGVEPKIGVPQNGWFIRENPIRIDDLEGKSTIFGNTLLKLQKRSLGCFPFCWWLSPSCWKSSRYIS